MAETDPKYGLHAVARGFQDLADVAHSLDGRLGIAGAVAEEEAVVLGLVERMVPGNDVDAGAALHEAADLVDLEAAIHGADAGEPRGIHGVGFLRGLERHLLKGEPCTGWGICSDSCIGLTMSLYEQDAPPSCQAPQPVLPISHQQNQAEGGTTRIPSQSRPSYQSRCTSM